MAGVKGRSGGPRANSGGARPNSGPKRQVFPAVVVPETDDSAAFLAGVMNDTACDIRIRVDAAKALLRIKADIGKKGEQADKAKKAGAGKFAASAPPLKLVSR